MFRTIFRGESKPTRRTSGRFVPGLSGIGLEGRISPTTMGGMDVTITVTNEPTTPTQAIVYVTDLANMPTTPMVVHA
jgi:hypothetical protein